MKTTTNRVPLAPVLLVVFTILANQASACTGITLDTEDGSVVYGRTMELGSDLMEWGLAVSPRGISFTGSTPWGGPGAEWSAKYAIVGVNAFGLPVFIDGVNEAGLAAGAFMFPEYVGYQSSSESDAYRTINSGDLVNWVLSSYATVEEVKESLPNIRVTGDLSGETDGFTLPLHWLIVDESGDAIVIEYIDGELNIHDDPVGVITNSPPFDWHLANLKYYIHLTSYDELPREVCGEMITPTGRGSGMLGLPGDFTPPSRFIRASYFKDSVVPVAGATEGVLQLFHILNQFDIPRGVVSGFKDGQLDMERTDWTSSVDLTNRRYYIHTAGTRCIHMIDLMQSPVDSEELINIPLPEEEVFVDLTPAQEPVLHLE